MLTNSFCRLGPKKILVLGDLMLDVYTFGRANRISPESPVPVVLVNNSDQRPGGAGNVMLNLLSLGVEVMAVGRVGCDVFGESLKKELTKEGVDVRGIVSEKGFVTPTKNRILADNQQVVRIDHERVEALSEDSENKVMALLEKLLDGVSVLAISDYAKGFCTRSLLKRAITLARERGIPVIVDPKGMDFTKYAGATVVKPNQKEAYAAAGADGAVSIDCVAAKIFEKTQIDHLMITRSQEGIAIFDGVGKREDFPVAVREVKDVTGAGDTVLAVMCQAYANGLGLAEIAELANVAAGIAIERIGCARITLSDLACRLLDFDTDLKVFGEKQLFALEHALRGRSTVLAVIDEAKTSNYSVLNRLLTLNESDKDLVVYIRDASPDDAFVHLLSSIKDVNFIVLKVSGENNLVKVLNPSKVVELDLVLT